MESFVTGLGAGEAAGAAVEDPDSGNKEEDV